MTFQPIEKQNAMVNGRIECIILAAGESKRMGKPKLLMPLGQGTVLEKTVHYCFELC